MDTTPRGLYIEFQNWVESVTNNGSRPRLIRNFDYYDGTQFKQWSKELVELYQQQGRTLTTFNIIQGIVDSMLGHLEQEPIGPVFSPIGDDTAKGASPFTQAWEADEALGQWEQKFLDYRRDALIHTGILQMFVNYDKDRLGRIDFKLLNPKNFVSDPYWVTRDIKDCRGVYAWTWLTAEQISSYYKKSAEAVKNAIENIASKQTQVANVHNRDVSPEFWDSDASQYKVIEFVWQESVDSLVVISVVDGQRVESFPLEEIKGMSEEIANDYVATKNRDFMVIRESISVTKTRTIVPGLDFELILEEGEYPIQLGRLPFFLLSFRETYDNRQGVADTLIDLQDIFNKRQNMVTHALGGSIGASNIAFEESAFGGDDDLEEEFRQNVTKNGQLLKVKDGAISGRKYLELQRPQMPLDVLKSADDIMNLMFRLSGITPAMDGYSDRADESGRLYQQKVRQSMVSLEYFAQSYWHKIEEMAESYMVAFKQIYAGVSRKIVNPRTGDVVELNKVIIGQDGPIKVHDVANLPAHFVRIEQRRTGKSMRDEQAQQASLLLPAIKNPLLSAYLEGRAVSANANDDIERNEIESAVTTWSEVQNRQLQNILKPPAPPAPPGGQGAPQQMPAPMGAPA